jgi:hypothetical protein
MTNLKKIAASISVIGLMAASSAALASGGAVALTQTSPGFYSGTFSQTYLGLTSFTDDWTFTLPIGPAGQAAGTAIAGFNPTNGALTAFFTAGSIWNITTNTLLAPGAGSFSGGLYNIQFTLPGALNPSDTYALRLTGTTLASGGSYAGSINVTPVPEPESYALFLAGLGLMGFIARRRTAV